MQVEDQIELPLPQILQQLQVVSGSAASMKVQQFVQERMPFEQIREFVIDDPGNFRVRESLTQHRQQRQRLDNVTEGARLDDANASNIQFVEPTIQTRGRHPNCLP